MATLEQARQRSERRAYEAGRSGRAFSVDIDDPVPVHELQSIYDNARAERHAEADVSPRGEDDTAAPGAAAPAVARRSPRRQTGGSFTRPGGPRMVNDGAGFVLGLLGYALFINFTRGGRTQARAWLAAKFLNRPMGVAASGATAPARGTSAPAPKPSTGLGTGLAGAFG